MNATQAKTTKTTQDTAEDPAAVARAVLAGHEVSDRFKVLAAEHGAEIAADLRLAHLDDWAPRVEAVTS